jgi:hypothetical protein
MNKSNTKTKKSKQVSLTVDGVWGIAKSIGTKVRESKLTVRID